MIQPLPKAEWNKQSLPSYFAVTKMSSIESRWPRIDQFSFYDAICAINHQVKTPYSFRNSDQLTAQEETILILRSVGMTALQTEDNLSISQATINTHLKRAYRKLNGKNNCNLNKATALALAYGIINVVEPFPHTTARLPEYCNPILQAIAEGKTNEEIVTATALPLEEVKNSIPEMYRHVGLPSREALTLHGYLSGGVNLLDVYISSPRFK